MTTTKQYNISILYVEDEKEARDTTTPILRRRIENLYVANNGIEAFELYKKHEPDLVLSDIRMPKMNGLELADKIKQINPDAKIIIMTAYTDYDYMQTSIDLQVDGYIVKPVRKEKLISTIAKQAKIINLQKEIKKYTTELQQRNEDLDAYAHTVAHDLKSPLGNMMAFADLLRHDFENLTSNEVNDYTTSIINSGFKTQQIITSLLLFASVRQEDIKASVIDMGSICNQAIAHSSSLIKKTNAQISFPDKWPSGVMGEQAWIEEAVTNYLSNAIKYGGSPPIIKIGYDTNTTKKGMIRFWVRDNGNGISADHQKTVFNKFERLNNKNKHGYGLGLSIVKRIINKLNGEIGVESKHGEGSLFYFTLPLKTDSQVQNTQPETSTQQPDLNN